MSEGNVDRNDLTIETNYTVLIGEIESELKNLGFLVSKLGEIEYEVISGPRVTALVDYDLRQVLVYGSPPDDQYYSSLVHERAHILYDNGENETATEIVNSEIAAYQAQIDDPYVPEDIKRWAKRMVMFFVLPRELGVSDEVTLDRFESMEGL